MRRKNKFFHKLFSLSYIKIRRRFTVHTALISPSGLHKPVTSASLIWNIHLLIKNLNPPHKCSNRLNITTALKKPYSSGQSPEKKETRLRRLEYKIGYPSRSWKNTTHPEIIIRAWFRNHVTTPPERVDIQFSPDILQAERLTSLSLTPPTGYTGALSGSNKHIIPLWMNNHNQTQSALSVLAWKFSSVPHVSGEADTAVWPVHP